MHFHVVVVRAVTEKKCTKKTDRQMDGWMDGKRCSKSIYGGHQSELARTAMCKSRARLGFSHFLKFSVQVNESLLSMFTIIKHIKRKVLSGFFQIPSGTKPMPSWFQCIKVEVIYSLNHLSLRMDLMCRGSKKYFTLHFLYDLL